MATLAEGGRPINDVTDKLLAEGVQLFSDAFGKLLKAVERQTREAGAERLNRLTYTLPESVAAAVKESLAEWHAHGKVRKLWARDASLWTGRDEGQWLGWLGITNDQLAHIDRLTGIREAARSAGFSHVLLLGMGGSSLGPEVIKRTFGTISGFPELHVLDSTDPAQVKSFENKVDLKNTLFIVSSKSARLSSLTFSSSISLNVSSSSLVRRKPAAAFSLLRILARRCNRSPNETAFGTCFRVGPTSAADTLFCPISAWFRQPLWAWT
jgi:transaldolase/glucose-6-phosphate isomerase